MSKRSAGYTKKMEQNLSDWSVRLEAIKARAGEPGSTESREQLEAWKTAGDAAQEKFVELRAAVARYGVLRSEMDVAWRGIDGSLSASEPAPPIAGEERLATGAPRRTA